MPRRGKATAWAAAALALATLGAFVPAGYTALRERWYGIPVVRTWGDLLAQEPIDLGGGVTVRVGIEAKRGPPGSGVLVYCLTQGHGPVARPAFDPLGPLQMSIVDRGGTLDSKAVWIDEGRQDSGDRLFVRTVPFQAPGKFEVRLLREKLLRFATLEATQEPFHPWMALETWKGSRLPGSGSGRERLVLANSADGVALPCEEGIFPWPPQETADGLAHPPRLLPSLLPRSDEPQLEMALAGDTLELRSMLEWITISPHRRFAARWWVNGQPFVPGPYRQTMESADASGVRVSGEILRFQLDFHPEQLGARSGDRVGVQLLYRARGWRRIGPQMPHRGLQIGASEFELLTLLTNRVDFTVP